MKPLIYLEETNMAFKKKFERYTIENFLKHIEEEVEKVKVKLQDVDTGSIKICSNYTYLDSGEIVVEKNKEGKFSYFINFDSIIPFLGRALQLLVRKTLIPKSTGNEEELKANINYHLSQYDSFYFFRLGDERTYIWLGFDTRKFYDGVSDKNLVRNLFIYDSFNGYVDMFNVTDGFIFEEGTTILRKDVPTTILWFLNTNFNRLAQKLDVYARYFLKGLLMGYFPFAHMLEADMVTPYVYHIMSKDNVTSGC